MTLIEILISVAILASAAVLVMHALAQGAYALTLAKNRLKAYTFAVAKMADLEVGFQRGIPPDVEGSFQGGGRQRFEWHVETSLAEEGSSLEQVTLAISWRQGPHTYESRTGMLRHVPEP